MLQILKDRIANQVRLVWFIILVAYATTGYFLIATSSVAKSCG